MILDNEMFSVSNGCQTDLVSGNASASLLSVIPARNALKVFNFVKKLKKLKASGVEDISGEELHDIAVKVFGKKVDSLSWDGQENILLSLLELLEVPEEAKDIARDSIMAFTNLTEED